MKTYLLTIIMTFTTFAHTQNLIQNSTFDLNGAAFGNGWYDYCNVELSYLNSSNQILCSVDLVNDAPSSSNSLSVHPQVMNPGSWGVRTFITGRTGTYVYELKYQMKSLMGNSVLSYGCGILGVYSNGEFTNADTLCASDSTWQQYVLIDTLTTTAADTICVDLYSPGPDFFYQHNYFDLVELTVTDSLLLTASEMFPKTEALVYPVPAQEQVSIEVPRVSNGCQLRVFNTLGQEVLELGSDTSAFRLNKSDLHAGVYFFHVIQRNSEIVLTRGKFIFE